MGLIPLPERSGIDLDNGTLYQSIRSHQLIVRCIIYLHSKSRSDPDMTFKHKRESTHHTDQAGLARSMLRPPRKVAGIETEGPVLQISSADTDCMNTLGTELR